MKKFSSVEDRIRRMAWWHEARFGMFIHWGLYAQTGRHEWVMNRERIPVAEYEKLAATWHPKPRPAREWAALAKQAGMKYMVMTTKHHEGFCLWDSKTTDYCATKHGPGRDLVREYVDACREFGLKIGFYYSLMDWHHPDGHACERDEQARRRFIAYTHSLVEELMTNYGKIDILWYDVPYPLQTPELWESRRLNAMARKHQPHILINNRSKLPEDFSTPEEHIVAESDDQGRGWEACMTFNGAWGFMDTPDEDWHGARKVLAMLNQCTAGGGNLLLNIGPKADGSVPQQAIKRLHAVGAWLKQYGEAVYGKPDRASNMEWLPITAPTTHWTRKKTTMYLWVARWPGKRLTIGGLRGKVLKAGIVGGVENLSFKQEPDRLIIDGLPAKCPDKILKVALLKIKFKTIPTLMLGCGCEPVGVDNKTGENFNYSPYMTDWLFSLPAAPVADISRVKPIKQKFWQHLTANATGFAAINKHYANIDGVVYLKTNVRAKKAGSWELLLGHDGPAKVFVDGKAVASEKKLLNPCRPDRTKASIKLAKGVHEILVALSLAKGKGCGIRLRFKTPPGSSEKNLPEQAKI